MKNSPLFFIAIFGALALSFGALVLGSRRQFGQLDAYFDAGEGAAFPARAPGLAARGMLVYRELGCAACHTQQVRRPAFGTDKERGECPPCGPTLMYHVCFHFGFSFTVDFRLVGAAGASGSAPAVVAASAKE